VDGLLRTPGFDILEVDRYYLRNRIFNPTLWSMAFGTFGAVLYAASVVAALALFVRVCRDRTDVRSGGSEPVR
jgi:hypothetical protein